MVMKDQSELVGMKIITQDAFLLGEVVDIRYDPVAWKVLGLKIRTNKSVTQALNAGSGRSMILLEPGDFIINDVILLPDDMEGARGSMMADNESFSSLSYLSTKKVVTSDGVLLGSVDSISIDLAEWRVVSFKVKLDKSACPSLDLKKGIFAKRVTGLLTRHIASVAENINLVLNVDDVKDTIIVD